jgi:hypothetical protein
MLRPLQSKRAGRADAQLLEPVGQLGRVAQFIGDFLGQRFADLPRSDAIEPHRVGQIIGDRFQFGRVGLFQQFRNFGVFHFDFLSSFVGLM